MAWSSIDSSIVSLMGEVVKRPVTEGSSKVHLLDGPSSGGSPDRPIRSQILEAAGLRYRPDVDMGVDLEQVDLMWSWD